ncbi:MAG: winged helix-turn-helix domain-containing protein [Acidobacteriia bacterium]|nr:winged helix-turn-helix domain-containing protein [Terriglobia bacterium]
MIHNGSQVEAQESCGRLWRFANCEFDDLGLQLRVNGQPVELELKPLELLVQLLDHAGEVLTKEKLLESVWPGLTVVDGSLATAMSKLRRALGDEDSSIVVTVPRVGYRLGVAVQYKSIGATYSTGDLDLKAGNPVPGRGQWRLIRSLETSAGSEVWLAEHPKTRDLRVFKFATSMSRLKGLKREVTVARFLRETLGEHPHFVRLLEWNFDTPPHFLESEYGGLDLAQWAQDQGGLAAIPLQLRLRVLAEVAGAVAAAHQAGVLHKDLKPSNILVMSSDRGPQIKVADFGSASLIEPSRLKALGITNLGLTQTLHPQSPSLSGTLMYIAPETMSGEPPTAVSDIYALGVILYQLVAGDFRRPLAPGWEAGVEDPLLREDIAQAACGDPALRLATASELARRIADLDKRRLERERLAQTKRHEQIVERRKAEARARLPWVAFAVLAFTVAAAISFGFYKMRASSAPRPASVAVLPFQNAAGDSSIDFLRFALPDEITTTLSHMHPLSIRPFANASKYSDPSVDLQKVGRDLGVNRIVTGHYLLLGRQLQITMEAVDVDSNRLLWRDTVNVPAKDFLAMQAQIAASAHGRLAPVLGASVFERNGLNPPRNEEAYNLYLRSIPFTGDPAPNQQALAMLERSVALDPTYAPAWAALSNRSYSASRFGGAGAAMLQRSDAAAERALALDPDSVDAVLELVVHRTERGDLVNSFLQAQNMVRRRPDSAQAHHALNYVLRYAGLLQEAARQCDTAYLLEPQITWGSCSSTFMELGNYKRARDFIRKDLSSEWSKAHAVEILVREGKGSEALQIGAPHIPDWESYNMLLACVQHKPAQEISSLAKAVKSSDDPEVNYFFAAHLAYCGQSDAALRMLKLAIQGKHCSYPAMDTDPLFASLRSNPKFAEVHSSAVECQNDFLAKRDQQPH